MCGAGPAGLALMGRAAENERDDTSQPRVAADFVRGSTSLLMLLLMVLLELLVLLVLSVALVAVTFLWCDVVAQEWLGLERRNSVAASLWCLDGLLPTRLVRSLARTRSIGGHRETARRTEHRAPSERLQRPSPHPLSQHSLFDETSSQNLRALKARERVQAPSSAKLRAQPSSIS